MIFNVKGHIEQIVSDKKTQTRRDSERYIVGQTYAIQPGRGKAGDPRGRILIIRKWQEKAYVNGEEFQISKEDAKAEGGYTPEHYEMLYEGIHPFWLERWCYEFEFWAKEDFESLWAAREEARKHPSIPWSTIKSQQLRNVSDPSVSAEADELETAKSESVPASSGRKTGEKKK